MIPSLWYLHLQPYWFFREICIYTTNQELVCNNTITLSKSFHSKPLYSPSWLHSSLKLASFILYQNTLTFIVSYNLSAVYIIVRSRIHFLVLNYEFLIIAYLRSQIMLLQKVPPKLELPSSFVHGSAFWFEIGNYDSHICPVWKSYKQTLFEFLSFWASTYFSSFFLQGFCGSTEVPSTFCIVRRPTIDAMYNLWGCLLGSWE